MARDQTDLIDIAALVLIPITAGMELGVWSFAVEIFGGFDFSQAIFSSGGTKISAALLATVGAFMWIFVTNDQPLTSYSDEEMTVLGAGVLVVPLFSLIPAVRNFVGSSDLLAFAAWMLVAIVSVYISYIE